MMNNLAWLESIATKTDFDSEFDEILKEQSFSIQMAYQFNDSSIIKNVFCKTNELANRNTIFQF